MFRAFVLSIVLLFATGPDAALLCQALCARTAGATEACGHEGETPAQVAAAGDCCADMVAVPTASRNPAMLTGTSIPVDHTAVLLPRDLFQPPIAASRRGYDPDRAQSLDRRPLPTILRL